MGLSTGYGCLGYLWILGHRLVQEVFGFLFSVFLHKNSISGSIELDKLVLAYIIVGRNCTRLLRNWLFLHSLFLEGHKGQSPLLWHGWNIYHFKIFVFCILYVLVLMTLYSGIKIYSCIEALLYIYSWDYFDLIKQFEPFYSGYSYSWKI